MPAVRTVSAGLVVLVLPVSLSAQRLEFSLQVGRLDRPDRVVPVLESTLTFGDPRPDTLRSVPPGLSQVAFTSIQYSSTARVIGLKGRAKDGSRVVIIDRNGNGDLADDLPVVFAPQAGLDQARIDLLCGNTRAGRARSIRTTLVLVVRKPDTIEYHFDELWEAELRVGGERLRAAVQRWPLLFLDVDLDRTYRKVFFPEKEVLALGGRFFRVAVDWSAGAIRLEPTDQRPVDAGHPAPDFDVTMVGTGRRFNLSAHRGSVVVLTFWSPLCSGSRAEAERYHELADAFSTDSRVRFVAVTTDADALAQYLKAHRHAFGHVVSPELWATYGVTAPFVTFVIDTSGQIVRRTFGFDATLSTLLRALTAGVGSGPVRRTRIVGVRSDLRAYSAATLVATAPLEPGRTRVTTDPPKNELRFPWGGSLSMHPGARCSPEAFGYNW